LYRSFIDNTIGISLIAPRIVFLMIVYYLYSCLGKPEYYYNTYTCGKIIERYYFFYITKANN
jgi:hypothetical protein